jgi:hypothetical protein
MDITGHYQGQRLRVGTPGMSRAKGRLTLPISGPLRGGLVARPLQAGPERWARGLPNGDHHPYPNDARRWKP